MIDIDYHRLIEALSEANAPIPSLLGSTGASWSGVCVGAVVGGDVMPTPSPSAKDRQLEATAEKRNWKSKVWIVKGAVKKRLAVLLLCMGQPSSGLFPRTQSSVIVPKMLAFN